MTEMFRATNTEAGMQACVHSATMGGFNVVVQDLDSGEYVPTVRNYPTVEAAIEKAKEVLKGV